MRVNLSQWIMSGLFLDAQQSRKKGKQRKKNQKVSLMGAGGIMPRNALAIVCVAPCTYAESF